MTTQDQRREEHGDLAARVETLTRDHAEALRLIRELRSYFWHIHANAAQALQLKTNAERKQNTDAQRACVGGDAEGAGQTASNTSPAPPSDAPNWRAYEHSPGRWGVRWKSAAGTSTFSVTFGAAVEASEVADALNRLVGQVQQLTAERDALKEEITSVRAALGAEHVDAKDCIGCGCTMVATSDLAQIAADEIAALKAEVEMLKDALERERAAHATTESEKEDRRAAYDREHEDDRRMWLREFAGRAMQGFLAGDEADHVIELSVGYAAGLLAAIEAHEQKSVERAEKGGAQ